MADCYNGNPILSIIIPVYNVGPYIRECLKSIEGQSFKDYEVLMIDDGSTDGSSAACRMYSKDERFTYVYKENGGVSSARNLGLDMARGKYLAFVDPDDILAKNMYESMISKLESENADFVQCITRVLRDNGTYDTNENRAMEVIENMALYFGKKDISCNNDEVLQEICSNGYNCLSWGKVFRRELWGNARYPLELSLGEDMATVIPVIAKANKAMIVRDTCYYYRIRKRSLLHGTVTKERFLEDMEGSKRMYEALIKEHPEITEGAACLKEHYDMGCLSNYLISAKKTKKSSMLYALMEVSDLVKEFRETPYLSNVCKVLADIKNV